MRIFVRLMALGRPKERRRLSLKLTWPFHKLVCGSDQYLRHTSQQFRRAAQRFGSAASSWPTSVRAKRKTTAALAFGNRVG
eukprot:449290-Pleurochrysis_carterae.AAC.1